MWKKSKKLLLSLLTLGFIASFAMKQDVNAYPGSGQGKAEVHPIQVLEEDAPLEEISKLGNLVNPLMNNVDAYIGEEAVFGGSCLTCHGAENGAQSASQPYYNGITYELIRVSDGKSMVQQDGSLLIELDPNGGITKYKLIVGLSEDVYDGGVEDDRALAGWHFALPNGIKMDLPYCMHILGPNLSKIYEGDSHKVFSDIKVAAYPEFKDGKGILQIISGTQNANPHENKTYGSVIVDYKLVEGTPVESDGSVASLPSPTAADMDHLVVINGGETDEGALATMGPSSQEGSESNGFTTPTWFYVLIIGAIVGFIIFIIIRRPKLS